MFSETAPRAIPSQIAMLHEDPLPPEAASPAGIPGGIWGGLPAAALNTISPAAKTAPAPPPPEKPLEPIRVGGKVTPPQPIYAPQPIYPVLARQARVQGLVVLDATFDAQGSVTNLSVISGPQLLYGAALQAVKTWRYQPVYLNGVPVPFEMEVTVHFHLE